MTGKSLSVARFSAEKWQELAVSAHATVFNERLPPEYDRIDFALVAFQGDMGLGYVTCRELDKESLYLKHGGAFPPAEKSPLAVRGYAAILDWSLARYRRLTTLVENTNRAYLKLAISHGWRPIGIRNFKGSVLVELFLGEE